MGFVMDFFWNILAKETLDNNTCADILWHCIRRMSGKFANVVNCTCGNFVKIKDRFASGKVKSLSGIIKTRRPLFQYILFLFSIALILNCDGCSDNPVKDDSPELYDLTAPASVQVDSTDTLFFSVAVRDPQGLSNIDRVFFTIKSSDSSLICDTLFMTDDGQDGDSIADDGIYSHIIVGGEIFTQNGEYLFEFAAFDIDNNQSNVLSRIIAINSQPQPYVYNLEFPDFLPIGFTDTVCLHLSVRDIQGLDDIDKVYFTIEMPDGSIDPDTSFMHDDGQLCDDTANDGIYGYSLTSPDTSYETGDYIFHFTAVDLENNQGNIISDTITYYDLPNPYVYNLIAPDSLQKGSPDTAYLFLSVWDPQGHSNIDQVYFTVTKPDSSSSGIGYLMFDRGDNGDSVAGDGIYTLGILAPSPENQSGDYIFRFTAVDDDSNFANIIDKVITAYDDTVSASYRVRHADERQYVIIDKRDNPTIKPQDKFNTIKIDSFVFPW